MLEALNAAAAGMAAQQRRMEALADDVANSSTTGYKRERLAFRDLVYTAQPQGANRRVATGAGTAVDMIGRGFVQGSMQTTDRKLDLAIQGQGFLEVRRADGTVGLTRDGSLQVDSRGQLVTSSGDRVQPAITVPPGVPADRLEVAADGTVTADGRALGRLRLVDVRSVEGLAPAGDNLFVPTAASGPIRAAAGTQLTSGALEASNVEMADVMVDMMDAQRSYQLASRAVQMQDQMLGVANGVKR
jgi:flagellar basal-body rod protein FlgG